MLRKWATQIQWDGSEFEPDLYDQWTQAYNTVKGILDGRIWVSRRGIRYGSCEHPVNGRIK